jgi:hypothetical protein
MSRRIPAADDFEAIRLRLQELRRERAGLGDAAAEVKSAKQQEPDPAGHIPRHIRTPVPVARRHSGSV